MSWSPVLIDLRSKLSDIEFMTGHEFIRKIRKLGRQTDLEVTFVARRGKGSHGTLYYGNRFTIVRNH